ncbi:hypothetical protein HDV63DRAFT_53657 [Trichoderma sp. SZMC 28014]
MNALSNTAFFKIHTKVTLKRSRRRNKKERIYLCIYPEWIRDITSRVTSDERKLSAASAKHYSLHFSLTKPPELIGPPDIPLESKGTSKTQLDLIQDLAVLTEFTIDLESSGTAACDETGFQLLTTQFSSENHDNRPRKDSKHGNVATLYTGNGGEAISVNINADPDLPPYISAKSPYPSSNKRQRHSPEDDDRLIVDKRQRPDYEDECHTVDKNKHPRSDFEDGCPTADQHRPLGSENGDLFTTKHAFSLMQDLWTRVEAKMDDFNTHLERSVAEIKGTVGDLNTRLDNIERSITEIKDTVEDLNTSHTPCRYNSEEKQDIIEEMEERYEDYILELKGTYYDVAEDLDKDCDKAKTDMRETCKEAIDQCNDQFEEVKDKFTKMQERWTEALEVLRE